LSIFILKIGAERRQANICLTCNSGRVAIGAFYALKSKAIAQNVPKELSG
jgi:hypothetical protein